MGFYIWDSIKRIDVLGDSTKNKRDFFVFDSTEKVTFLYQSLTSNYVEYRGQGKIANFPLNKAPNDTFTGLYFVYKWNDALKAWMVDSELPKSTQFDKIQTNTIQPINTILEFKNKDGSTSLGNIDTSTNKLTWQKDVDVKGQLNVTGNILSGGLIRTTNEMSSPTVRTNTIRPVEIDGTSLLRLYDAKGEQQITLSSLADETIFNKKIRGKENVLFEKDLEVTGKIINTDLNSKLLDAGKYKIVTTAERLTYINDVANLTKTCVFLDTTLDKQLAWFNGYCYESPDGVTSQPVFPIPATITDGMFFYDSPNQVVYKWNSVGKFWGLIESGFIGSKSDLGTVESQYVFTDNVYLSFLRNPNYTVDLKTSRPYSKFDFTWRLYKSPNFAMVDSAVLKGNGTSKRVNLNTIDEGKLYEFTINDLRKSMSFTVILMFVNNYCLIKDRWEQIFTEESANDYQTVTTGDRKIVNGFEIPMGSKTYYDETLGKPLLCRPNASVSPTGVTWADFDGIFENIIFPSNPTDGQTYTSPQGSVYTYSLANAYWLKSNTSISSVSMPSIVMKSIGNATYNVNTTSDIGLSNTIYSTGTGIEILTNSFKLKKGVTYRLEAKVQGYFASTVSTCYISYMWCDTSNNILSGTVQGTQWGGTGGNWTPDGGAVGYYTPASDTEVKLRITKVNSSNFITISGNPSNTSGDDGGDSYCRIEEVSKSEMVLTKQEGTYASSIEVQSNNNTISTSVGTDINVFKDVISQIGDGIVNNTDGTYTLKAGKTFKIRCQLSTSASTNFKMGFGIYDYTNSKYIGTGGTSWSTDGNTSSGLPLYAVATITTVTDIKIGIKCNWINSQPQNVQFYKNTTSNGGSVLEINELGSSKVYTDTRVDILGKQNYAKVVNSSSSVTDGDFWRDSTTNDLIYRKNTTDVNLTRVPPIIKIVRSGNYNISTGWSKIQHNVAQINTSDSTAVDLTNYRIVVPETGYYEVTN